MNVKHAWMWFYYVVCLHGSQNVDFLTKKKKKTRNRVIKLHYYLIKIIKCAWNFVFRIRPRRELARDLKKLKRHVFETDSSWSRFENSHGLVVSRCSRWRIGRSAWGWSACSLRSACPSGLRCPVFCSGSTGSTACTPSPPRCTCSAWSTAWRWSGTPSPPRWPPRKTATMSATRPLRSLAWTRRRRWQTFSTWNTSRTRTGWRSSGTTITGGPTSCCCWSSSSSSWDHWAVSIRSGATVIGGVFYILRVPPYGILFFVSFWFSVRFRLPVAEETDFQG